MVASDRKEIPINTGRVEPYGYITGDAGRLFLNTALGCNSECSYCYLPLLGLPIGTKILQKISANKISQILDKTGQIVPGKSGTIISLGCFSECWDASNRSQTKTLMDQLIPLGNPIQLATKRYIDLEDLKPFISKFLWEGQLSVYISSSTISEWARYERGTTSPRKRFESFNLKNLLNIPTFLYMKPVIDGVTIADVEKYLEVIRDWSVGVIVGDVFTITKSKNIAPVGEGRLYSQRGNDADYIAAKFEKVTSVWRRSVEVVDLLRTENPTRSLFSVEARNA